jgi:predicted Zn-dependent protease
MAYNRNPWEQGIRSRVRRNSDQRSKKGIWRLGGAESVDKAAGLREILSQDPGNAFTRYGLAMELAARGETEAALEEFARLLSGHPDYTAGYFMAAQTLAKAKRVEEAKQRLVEGIAVARRTGNQHALGEMEAMLDEYRE